MTPSQPPDPFPIELLAAYVDGELDAATRAMVDQWLQCHPERYADLLVQHELSPLASTIWDRSCPPDPSEQTWAAAQQNICRQLDQLRPKPHVATPWEATRTRWKLAGVGLAVTCAAAIAWLWVAPGGPAPPAEQPEIAGPAAPAGLAQPAASARNVAPQPRPSDPLRSLSVLTLASEADVILLRVPEFPSGWLPVGRYPFTEPMVLATSDDVSLTEATPSSAWPPGGLRITPTPGDAPMIFGAKPR
jgi:anti-sigma factor RsiW